MTRPVAELVEGLRELASERFAYKPAAGKIFEAAAALERLEAENQRLRVTIARPLVCEHGTHWMHWCGQCENAAIDAARGK
jgi:hypothetical protein